MARSARRNDLAINISKYGAFFFHSSKGDIGDDMPPLMMENDTPPSAPHFDVAKSIEAR